MKSKVNMKSGLTMLSIVVYVTLFFSFTIFAIAMSTNMNLKALSEKGNIIVNEDYQKLEYNLLKSAKKSSKVDIIDEKIVFSNNDEYVFDLENKTIIKNGGTLIKNVESLDLINLSNIDNLPVNYIENVDENINNIVLEVSLKKYEQEKKSQIFLTLGDEINE